MALAAAVATGWLGIAACGDTSPDTAPTEAVEAPSLDTSAPIPPHRVVWARSIDDPRDTWLNRPGGRLMGFDSETGTEHVLLEGPERFIRPLFTPDGDWVVFSTSPEVGPGAPGVVVERVRWDGSGREVIAQGMAIDSRRDDAGETWIYIGREIGDPNNYTAQRIERLPWSDPERVERVWDRLPVTVDNAQVSGDGRWMSGGFPWPEAGRADLHNGEFEPVEQGCWTSMAPDDSGVMWVFDGRHRNVRLRLGDEIRPVRINDGPGVDGFEVYHPRWSNHPHYFACTGPYLEGETDIRITGGGTAVGIMIGRFNAELTTVERWWRITDEPVADFYPDLWIAGGGDESLDMELVLAAESAGARRITPTLGEQWPPSREGLQLLWEHARAGNEWTPAGQSEPLRQQFEGLGNAVLGSDYQLQLWGGAFTPAPAAGERIAASARASNQFSWSGIVTAAEAKADPPGRVMSLSNGEDERNFSLDQDGDRWVVRWRTMWSRDSARDTEVDIGPVEPGRPTHMVISYHQPELRVWIDGELESYRRGRNHDLGNWTPQEWIIGNEWGGGAPWHGRIEALLWYDRALTSEEAGAIHTAVAPRLQQLQSRRDSDQPLRVRARLQAANPVPELADIHPYRSHLEVFSWQVEEVLEGELENGGSDIEVLQWVILNGDTVPGSEIDIGEARLLQLAPLDRHPQLEGASQGAPAVERLHLPVYYRVEPPGDGWQGVPPVDARLARGPESPATVRNDPP